MVNSKLDEEKKIRKDKERQEKNEKKMKFLWNDLDKSLHYSEEDKNKNYVDIYDMSEAIDQEKLDQSPDFRTVLMERN